MWVFIACFAVLVVAGAISLLLLSMRVSQMRAMLDEMQRLEQSLLDLTEERR